MSPSNWTLCVLVNGFLVDLLKRNHFPRGCINVLDDDGTWICAAESTTTARQFLQAQCHQLGWNEQCVLQPKGQRIHVAMRLAEVQDQIQLLVQPRPQVRPLRELLGV